MRPLTDVQTQTRLKAVRLTTYLAMSQTRGVSEILTPYFILLHISYHMLYNLILPIKKSQSELTVFKKKWSIWNFVTNYYCLLKVNFLVQRDKKMNASSNFLFTHNFLVNIYVLKRCHRKQKQNQNKTNKNAAEIHHVLGTVLLSKKTKSTQEFHNLF